MMWDTLALATLEEAIGHRFEDRTLLERALTHRSWIEERHPGGRAPAHLSQQRLEFLGDAVLGYVVGRWLYDRLPEASEKELTSLRKEFARGAWLQAQGARLNLEALVRRGRGEAANAERNRKLLEDTVEALIGAVALDGSEARAAEVIRAWLPEDPPSLEEGDPIVVASERHQGRYKTALPEPDYVPWGPDHKREWIATLTVGGGQGVGRGGTKQDAKREACRSLLLSGAL